MTDIHALRNRLTTAALTVTAMIDDKLPSTRANLQRVAQTLADMRAIVANVRGEDWSAGNGSLVDLREITATVVRAMMMLSAAADVKLEIVQSCTFHGCRAMQAEPIPIYRALDGALQMLLRAAPAGSTIQIEQSSTRSLNVRVRTPGDAPNRDLFDQIAQCLDAQGGSAHRLGPPEDGYCLHFPGSPICECASSPPCE